ncbi:hypothetical protein ACP4OV_024455 [Aristida adscensionis]
MASSWAEQPSLEFGVKVVRVAGLEPAGREGGTLFVRYYVPAGDGRRRLRVDTREVPCGGGGGDAFWGELARFERWGGCGAAGAEAGAVGLAGGGRAPAAPGGGLVFELRWRPRTPPSGLAALLGTATGRLGRRPSRVLARAALAWRDVAADGVAAASQAPAERWLTLSPEGRGLAGGCKAPRLLVEVKIIRAAAGGEVTVKRPGAGGVMDDERCSGGECCGECGWVGSEDDMFLAATFS